MHPRLLAIPMLLIAALLVVTGLGSALSDLPDVTDRYFAVIVADKRTGYVRLRRTVAQQIVATETKIVFLTVAPDGTSQPQTIFQRERETLDGTPLSVHYTRTKGSTPQVVAGIIANGRIDLACSVGSQQIQKSLVWPDGAVLNEGIQRTALARGFEPGTAYDLVAFDAATREFVRVAVRVAAPEQTDVLGRVMTLNRVDQVVHYDSGQLEATVYYDSDATMMKTILTGGFSKLGMEYVACDKALAFSGLKMIDASALYEVECPTALSEEDLQQAVTYRISLPDGLEILTDDTQTIQIQDDATILLTVASVDTSADALIAGDTDDPNVERALQASPYVESDDERIIEAARAVVGDRANAAEAAAALESYVTDYIDKKDYSLDYATATEVLRSRQGDCSEHAVLLAAMCRASGIPTEVVSGIAYVDYFGDLAPSFRCHAWVRCYIGGRWVHYDAALGHGAGHIALATGDEPNEAIGLGEIVLTMTIIEAQVKQP